MRASISGPRGLLEAHIAERRLLLTACRSLAPVAPADMAQESSLQCAGVAFKIRHTGSRRRRVRLHYL